MPHEFKFSAGDVLECKLTPAILHVGRRVIDVDTQVPLYWITDGRQCWLQEAGTVENDFDRMKVCP